MGNEMENWVSHGLSIDDETRIKTVEQLEQWIEEVGFLPLFRNEIGGFSVEEHTAKDHWWSGNNDVDPWQWREIITKRGNIAYGKFFHNRAGFISKEWFPHIANYRRDGYDFDSLYEDGKAAYRLKKIMDLFEQSDLLASHEMKTKAGFGKGGEKNFDGTITKLQMQTYLIVHDFKRKINKKGAEYGWPVAIYATPEYLFGEDIVQSQYTVPANESLEKIVKHVIKLYPNEDRKNILKVVK